MLGGASVAQEVRSLPADLAVSRSRPTEDGNLFNRKWGSIAHSFKSPPFRRSDMTEILLKRTQNLKTSILRFIECLEYFRIHDIILSNG